MGSAVTRFESHRTFVGSLEMRAQKNDKTELKKRITEIWQDVNSDVTEKLVNSIPRCLEEVIGANRRPTKY